MLISFTVDFDFEDEDDFENTIPRVNNYLMRVFQSDVKVEVPSQYTWSGYKNPFPTYCDIDEEDIPF